MAQDHNSSTCKCVFHNKCTYMQVIHVSYVFYLSLVLIGYASSDDDSNINVK